MTTWKMNIDAKWTTRLLLLVLLVTSTLQLLGCSASTESNASGQIQLEYLKASESAVSLKLTNGTNRTIAIRGSWTISLAVRTLQADSQVECELTPTGKTEAELPGFSHGKSGSIDVSPGKAVNLVVPTGLPNRYRGGTCKLNLILQDGASVGPIKFSP